MIRRDHLLHAETCALIVVAASALLPWWAAGLLAVGAGAAKEMRDKVREGVPSWRDFAWDCAGALLGVALNLIR